VNGWSLRRIAERVGVSKSQVDRDMIAGVPFGTPENSANSPTVTGADGKTYPAVKNLSLTCGSAAGA
jgi:hypothetical protein